MTQDPHNITSSWPEVTSIDHVLNQWREASSDADMVGALSSSAWEDLQERLLAREDNIATILRLAGTQFGAMPGFVSEVVVLSGLGTPPTDEERQVIHDAFHRDYEELQRIIGEQGTGS